MPILQDFAGSKHNILPFLTVAICQPRDNGSHRGSNRYSEAGEGRGPAPHPPSLTHPTTRHYTTTALAPEGTKRGVAAQDRTRRGLRFATTVHHAGALPACPATVPPSPHHRSAAPGPCGAAPAWYSLGRRPAVPAAAAF